ncbi:MAG: hypothetical protein DME97_07360 [Verrucomicrobia bacterium]|nr:MAG: hypothetical protein DME97_07360 [Verrucomicrobiota bacterium]
MVVLLDTNALVQELPVELPSLKELAEYCRTAHAGLFLSEVVYLEFLGYVDREIANRVEDIEKALKRLPARVKHVFDKDAFSAETERLRKTLETRLQDFLDNHRLIWIPIAAEHARAAVVRAVERRAPCSPGGEQLRDAMIWEAALSAVHDYGGPLVLLSDDAAFAVDRLQTEVAEWPLEILRYASMREFLKAMIPDPEFVEPDALTRLISTNELKDMIFSYVARDPTESWESGVSNIIEHGIPGDLFLGSFSVTYVSDVCVLKGFRRPVGKAQYNNHLQFEARVGISADAFASKLIEPEENPITNEELQAIPAELRDLVKTIPKRIPVGEPKCFDVEFLTCGEVLLFDSKKGRKTALIDLDPGDAGLKGQPKSCKRILLD